MEPDEVTYYTTLGKLAPSQLGLDSEGDLMALALDVENDRTCVLVIRKNGQFEVHNILQVPMDWPVTRAKLMMIAAPIPEADARAETEAAAKKKELEAEIEAFGRELAKELG